jgi:UDP-N-acetylmuramyl-tripeptide synthetase
MKEFLQKAKESSRVVATLSTAIKNKTLLEFADALEENSCFIIEENIKDMKLARELDLSSAMQDRLYLNDSRIQDMANAIRQIASQTEPVANMMGIFNIYNLIASIAAVHITTNEKLENICKVVENFNSISGRMEIVSTKPLVIVDFAHTPDGMDEVLKSFPNKEIICVFGAGGNRDALKRPLMGEVASKYSKHIVVTSDNPRFEEPKKIIEDILNGIDDKSNVIVIEDRKEALKKAISLANDKSVVLILGKGDERAQIIGDKKFEFSDKDEVLKILEVRD